MGRPFTELVILESFKLQMYVLTHDLNWTLPEVDEFFERLFDGIFNASGLRLNVPVKQWRGRKERWNKEWQGRSSAQVFAELAGQTLWYEGGIDTVITVPPTSYACHCHSFTLNFGSDHTEYRRNQTRVAQAGPSTNPLDSASLASPYPYAIVQRPTSQVPHEDVLPTPILAAAGDGEYVSIPNGRSSIYESVEGSRQTAADSSEVDTQMVPFTSTCFLPLIERENPLSALPSNAKLVSRPHREDLFSSTHN